MLDLARPIYQKDGIPYGHFRPQKEAEFRWGAPDKVQSTLRGRIPKQLAPRFRSAPPSRRTRSMNAAIQSQPPDFLSRILNLADFWGARKEITIAERTMPVLMAIRHEFRGRSCPARRPRITGFLAQDHSKTAVLIEPEHALGAQVPLGRHAIINSTQVIFGRGPSAPAGVPTPVFAVKGESLPNTGITRKSPHIIELGPTVAFQP